MQTHKNKKISKKISYFQRNALAPLQFYHLTLGRCFDLQCDSSMMRRFECHRSTQILRIYCINNSVTNKTEQHVTYLKKSIYHKHQIRYCTTVDFYSKAIIMQNASIEIHRATLVQTRDLLEKSCTNHGNEEIKCQAS